MCCVQRLGYVIVRGSPQSGKTSLLQLCYHAAKNSEHFERVFYMAVHHLYEDEGFVEGFERLTKAKWRETRSPPSSPMDDGEALACAKGCDVLCESDSS